MKHIAEMTVQEILALTEEDIDEMAKSRMEEECLPVAYVPEYEKITPIAPPDIRVFTVKALPEHAFTSLADALEVSETLRNARSLRMTRYAGITDSLDRTLLPEPVDSENFRVIPQLAYSAGLYRLMGTISRTNRRIKARNDKKKRAYASYLSALHDMAMDIRRHIRQARRQNG